VFAGVGDSWLGSAAATHPYGPGFDRQLARASRQWAFPRPLAVSVRAVRDPGVPSVDLQPWLPLQDVWGFSRLEDVIRSLYLVNFAPRERALQKAAKWE